MSSSESSESDEEDEELNIAARVLRFLMRFPATTWFGAAAGGMARK